MTTIPYNRRVLAARASFDDRFSGDEDHGVARADQAISFCADFQSNYDGDLP